MSQKSDNIIFGVWKFVQLFQRCQLRAIIFIQISVCRKRLSGGRHKYLGCNSLIQIEINRRILVFRVGYAFSTVFPQHF